MEDELYELVVRENALKALYRLGVKPEDYKEYYKQEQGREYAIGAMMDAGNPLKDEYMEAFSVKHSD